MKKTLGNMTLKGERLKAFKIRSKPRMPFLFHIVLGVQTRAISQEKEINSIQIGKEVKL